SATIQGEARSRSHEKLERYLEDLKNVSSRVAGETGAAVNVDINHNYRSFLIPESSETIQMAGRVFKEMGIQMTVEAGGGGMDANRLVANGIECVGLATGYSKNHTTEEYLEVEDLIRSGEMVQKLIMEYSRKKT
ncbi:MAG: M20/M25/M40 family metallo-hydrolase, partial [Aminobacteriaceae bacterium]